MTNDFSKAPQSIGEIRSDRSQNCADWGPRDVPIALLREIDSGARKPDTLVVSYAEHVGDTVSTFYSCAAPNILTALGCVARSLHRMQAAAD